MKKVLFTATVDSHILNFHLPFIKYFKDNKYEVHVATNGSEKIPNAKKRFTVSFERSPLKINNLKAIFQLRKIIKEYKYDIIHTHTPMGSVVTRLAALGLHTRVIYTAHGFHFYKGASIINWIMFYPVEWLLSFATDDLILINKEDYDLAKCHMHAKHIHYVPGVGIDESKFSKVLTKKSKLELRESLGLNEDDFVMIYPAELSKRKNQEWLINTLSKSLHEHNDIKILLPGKDSLNGKLQKLVNELDLNDQVLFLGFRKDIPSLLQISDMSISTSKQEGLPVNIMEAMYIGLPIVATSCRGNNDLVSNNNNGFIVDQGDYKKLIYKVESIYYNGKKLSDRFGEGSKKIIKDYTLDKVMVEMKKVYE